MSDINAKMMDRHYKEQTFYGWFDEPAQTEPTYSPPLGGACPLCGRLMASGQEIKTHSLMYVGEYAARSYFYRTHKQCAENDPSHTAADGFIFDLIKRNGD